MNTTKYSNYLWVKEFIFINVFVWHGRVSDDIIVCFRIGLGLVGALSGEHSSWFEKLSLFFALGVSHVSSTVVTNRVDRSACTFNIGFAFAVPSSFLAKLSIRSVTLMVLFSLPKRIFLLCSQCWTTTCGSAAIGSRFNAFVGVFTGVECVNGEFTGIVIFSNIFFSHFSLPSIERLISFETSLFGTAVLYLFFIYSCSLEEIDFEIGEIWFAIKFSWNSSNNIISSYSLFLSTVFWK